MNAKINVKFVVILLLVAFIVTGGVGAVWYFRQADASQFFMQGDELFAQGEYEAASRMYSRGIGRDPANREYLRKYQEALLNVQPTTGVQARALYESYLASLQHAVQYFPNAAEYHLEFIEEIVHNAQSASMTGAVAAARSHWQQLVSAADDMLARLPQSDPQYSLGYLYRGWGAAELFATASESELDRAVEDLQTFIDANPDHDFGLAIFARVQRTLGEHFRTQGQRAKGDRLVEAYYETIESAYEKLPDGQYVLVAYAQYLNEQLASNPNDTILAEYIDSIADDIYDLARQSDDSSLMNRAAGVLLTTRNMDRVRQGFDAYAQFLSRNPDAHLHRYFLAQLHSRLDEHAQADALLREILDAEPLHTSFLSQLQTELRKRAAAALVDTAQKQWQNASPNERDRFAELVRQRHQHLRTHVADHEGDPLMIRADAMLALVEQDHHAAADRLERLIRQGEANHEVYALSSFALEQIGQHGLALDRMATAIESMPMALPNMLFSKARFEVRLGRFEAASESLQQLLAMVPTAADDSRVIQLSRTIEQRLDAGPGEQAPSRAGGDLDPPNPAVQHLAETQRHYDEGEVDSARALALQGLQQWPQDIRFHVGLARIEMLAGNAELAQEYLAQALAIQPDNRYLRQLEATLTTDDPIEAVHRYTNSIHEDDETERAITLLLTISSMRQHHARQHQLAIEQADEQKAAEHAALAERLREETDRVLEDAIRIAPTEPRVIEYRLNRAMVERDWNAAERLIEEAARANADQAGGLLFRGAYLLERGWPAQAVRVFQDATDRMPYSSQAWRGLGIASSRVGNVREAQRAFEQSYRINPNNLNTVREYMQLLVQVGDEARALRLARDSRRVFPQDLELRDVWLDLEARAGGSEVALVERRKRFREHPEDRRNAMRLALLLSQTTPTEHLILNEDGSREYSSRRWTLLSPSEQRRILESEARKWRSEVDQIVQSIYERHGRQLETVAFEATVQRHRGNVDQGERILRDFIDNVSPDERDVTQRMTLAQYLIEGGRHEQAIVELAAAREFQDPDRREADLAIANLRFMQNDHAAAKDLYEVIYETNPSREIALRLTESLVHLGQVDEARTRMEALRGEFDFGDRELIIEALIARGEAERHMARGEHALGQEKLAAHYQLIDETTRAMPTNPSPHIILAQTKLWEHRQTGRRDLLADARTALGRAAELAPDDSRITFMRVDVYRAQNDVRGAIHEINRLIERMPLLTQAHRVRLGLYVEAGDLNGAVEAARQSAESFPQSPVWQEQYSRLLVEAGRISEAADVAQRSFELGRTPAQLALYLGLELQLNRRNPQSLLQLVRENSELVESNMRLHGVAVLLTHRAGHTDEARQLATQSYRRLRSDLQEGRLGYREVQQWFNAHGDYFATFKPVEAEQFLVTARPSGQVEDEPLDFFELSWLARLWTATGASGISRAIELAERAEAIIPRDMPPQVKASLLFELSGYQIVMQDYSAAVQNLERVVELAPDNGLARNNLAFLLTDRFGQPERARVHAEHAYELLPENPSVVDTLGWTKFKLGQHDQAETLLRSALELLDTPTTRLHLAHLLIATNRRESAAENLRRALDLNPDEPTREEIGRLLADM